MRGRVWCRSSTAPLPENPPTIIAGLSERTEILQCIQGSPSGYTARCSSSDNNAAGSQHHCLNPSRLSVYHLFMTYSTWGTGEPWDSPHWLVIGVPSIAFMGKLIDQYYNVSICGKWRSVSHGVESVALVFLLDGHQAICHRIPVDSVEAHCAVHQILHVISAPERMVLGLSKYYKLTTCIVLLRTHGMRVLGGLSVPIRVKRLNNTEEAATIEAGNFSAS